MEQMKADKILQGAVVLVAILFGALTLFAGARVLGGADPGYIVFRPLLIFNTLMGFAYVAAGVTAWRNRARGTLMAGAIFVLNAVVLLTIAYLHQTGGAVAIDSVRAMTLRTVVWLVLLAALAWLGQRGRRAA